jgi:hypothetical protein
MTQHELLDHFAGIALAELVRRDNNLKGDFDKKVLMESSAKDAYTYAMMMFRNRDAAHEWLNKKTKEPQ